MAECGESFRTAEDYRDHLPCPKCSPAEDRNARSQIIRTARENLRSQADRELERANLLSLIERLLPYIGPDVHDRFPEALALEADVKKALGK